MATTFSNPMTLGKATVQKLEAIEENDKRVYAVVNLTKPRMVDILVLYENTVLVQTAKDTDKWTVVLQLLGASCLS